MIKTMDSSKISALMERNGRIFYKRWGYPLRVVFVLKDIKNSKTLLKNVCMDQNKVIVIGKIGLELPYAHTNMKTISFGGFLFDLKTLIFLLTKRSRRQQKGIDFVFTDYKKLFSFLNAFRGIITPRIVFGTDIGDLEKITARLIKEKKDNDKEAIG